MNLKWKHRWELWRWLLLLVVGAGLLGGQVWLWMLVKSSLTEWQRVRSAGEQQRIIADRSRAVEKMLQEQEILLDQLSIVAPPTSSAPQLIDRLERMADDRQLAIRILNITEGTGQTVAPLRLEMRASGSIDGLMSYMQAIEHLQELTSIEDWTLQPETVSRGVEASPGPQASPVSPQQLYAVEMTMSFYVQVNQKDG